MAIDQNKKKLFSSIFGYEPDTKEEGVPQLNTESMVPLSRTSANATGVTPSENTTVSKLELKKQLFSSVFGYEPDIKEPVKQQENIAIEATKTPSISEPKLPPLHEPEKPEEAKPIPPIENTPGYETTLPEKMALPQLSTTPEVAAIQSRFLSIQDPRAKALELKSLPQNDGVKLLDQLPEDQKTAVKDELQKLVKEDRKANAFAIGILQSTPVPAFFPEETKEELKATAEAAPLQTAAGQIVGTVAQAALGAGAINNVLAKTIVNKSPLLKTALTRVATSGGIAAEQNIGRKDIKTAIGDVVQQSGGGLVSLIPEIVAPPGVAQLIAQPLGDLVYDVAAGKIRGEKINSKDWWRNEIISLASSAGMAAKDAISGKTFALDQQAQRDELNAFLSKNKNAKIELTEGKKGGANESNISKMQRQAEAEIKPIEEIESDVKNTITAPEVKADNLLTKNVTEELSSVKREMVPENPEIELPKRQRGIFSESGAIGEKAQARLEFDDTPEGILGKQAQDKFDAQEEEVRKKFVPTLKQKYRDLVDTLGAGIVDREYYAKRLLKGEDYGDDVIGKLNASKGSSAEAKAQYEPAEKEISKFLPHTHEKLFNNYLQAKRIIEIEKNKGEGTISHTKGMTLDEANAYVNKVENGLDPKSSEAIKRSANKYWDKMKDQLIQLKDNGLITEESFKNLSAQGMYYSPRQFIQHIDPDKIQTGGSKVSVGDSGIKSLDQGSEEAMINNWRLLLSEVMARTQSRIYKNAATKELYNFAKDNKDNNIDIKEEIPLQRKIAVADAMDIATNLQGMKANLEARLKNPMTVEQRLRLEEKITVFEDKIDELTLGKNESDVDTDIEITELQKRALDLNNEAKKSDNINQSKYYENKINAINGKIDALAKYPKSKEIQDKINAMVKQRDAITDKIKNPLSGTKIMDMQSRMTKLDEKINKWGELINKANDEGSDEITFDSKQYKKLPPGYERISTVIDGQKKSVIVPTKFAESWNSSDKALSKSMANALSVLSGSALVRPFATGTFAPEFAVSNIPRDLAMQWLTTKEYHPVAPIALFQTADNFRRVLKDAWTGEGRYRDYIKQGGGMEYLNEQGRIMRDPTRPVTATSERNRQILGVFNKLQEFSERLGRLALREQALKNGKTPEEATQIAREYLDFAQGGSWAKALDNAIPYLNASIQGTRSVVRAVKDDTATTLAKIGQLMVMGAGLSYTSHALNSNTMDKMSDREKVQRWNFPLGIKAKGKKNEDVDVYFSIPKDQSSRLWATAGEVIAERQMGKISGDTAWRKIKMAFSDLNPIDMIGLIPPSASAFAGYILNKDFWTQDDIWKGRKVSPFMEYYEGKTSKALVDMAGALNKIGVKISPARIESSAGQVLPRNPITTLMGGAYRQVADGLPSNERAKIDKTAMDYLTSLPGTRKFFRKTYPIYIKDDFQKKLNDYGISVRDNKGRKKPLRMLQEEVEKRDQQINDIKQMDDAMLKEVSNLLIKGEREKARKKFTELRRRAGQKLGGKEVERIDNKFNSR
jgi:hypothetical protein